jgi:hypothetical protein
MSGWRGAALLLGLVATLAVGVPRAFADMTVATYMDARASGEAGQQDVVLAYLAGVLDGLTKANQAATKGNGPLFCPPNGSDALQARPLQALVDDFIKFSTQTQPSFAASAKDVSLGSITLIVLTNLYPCPSKGGGKG